MTHSRHDTLSLKQKNKNIYCTGGEKERAQQFDCPFSCYLDAIFRCSGSHLVDNLSIWLSNFLLLFLGVPLLCFLVFYIVTHLLQTQSKRDGPSAIYPAWCVSTWCWSPSYGDPHTHTHPHTHTNIQDRNLSKSKLLGVCADSVHKNKSLWRGVIRCPRTHTHTHTCWPGFLFTTRTLHFIFDSVGGFGLIYSRVVNGSHCTFQVKMDAVGSKLTMRW